MQNDDNDDMFCQQSLWMYFITSSVEYKAVYLTAEKHTTYVFVLLLIAPIHMNIINLRFLRLSCQEEDYYIVIFLFITPSFRYLV